jgi:hypothetical protein
MCFFRFQGAEKQYYVSKKCATAEDCDREIYGNMPLCHYIWCLPYQKQDFPSFTHIC